MKRLKLLFESCGKEKDRTAFYYYHKQRTALRDKCYSCYKLWLLEDTSGKRITSAEAKGYITGIAAQTLHVELATLRRDTNERRKEKLRAKVTDHHIFRKFLEAEYGIRNPTPEERFMFLKNPEAGAAFNLEQEELRAKYDAVVAKEKARRDKISATLRGRPRAPRAPSAAERLAAAARERSQAAAPPRCEAPEIDEHPDWPNED